MRVVVAIGGNALLERDEPPEATIQLAHIRKAAHALAPDDPANRNPTSNPM